MRPTRVDQPGNVSIQAWLRRNSGRDCRGEHPAFTFVSRLAAVRE
jgi:hypothetical protein